MSNDHDYALVLSFNIIVCSYLILCNIWKRFEKGIPPFAGVGATNQGIALDEAKARNNLQNKVCLFYPLNYILLFNNI